MITYSNASLNVTTSGHITISELFLCYKNALKWGKLTKPEGVRLVKEYTIVTTTSQEIRYTVDDKLHKTDGPAYIRYYKNGNKLYEEWYNQDVLHNTNGPAYIGYCENGNKMYEEWYNQDVLHNTNGPARIEYYGNGKKSLEEWYNQDNLHNTDGPARIGYCENGNKWYESWWNQDKCVKSLQF